jgi:DNA-binding MarR family transcriptional regulator
MNTKADREDQLVLELLDAVDRRSDVSQRHLANQLGVALGLANSYLKRCIRKGFIKISEAPANRYLYYLTPGGFAEKSRLTAKYLSTSFAFYRKAGESCEKIFLHCMNRGWNRVLLSGMSDLAEIAIVRATETDIDIVGIYDPHTERRRFASKPVSRSMDSVAAFDICMLTDLNAPLLSYEHVAGMIGRERVLVPEILGVSPAGET